MRRLIAAVALCAATMMVLATAADASGDYPPDDSDTSVICAPATAAEGGNTGPGGGPGGGDPGGDNTTSNTDPGGDPNGHDPGGDNTTSNTDPGGDPNGHDPGNNNTSPGGGPGGGDPGGEYTDPNCSDETRDGTENSSEDGEDNAVGIATQGPDQGATTLDDADGDLAATGTDASMLVRIAAMSVIAGGALIVVAWWRKRPATA